LKCQRDHFLDIRVVVGDENFRHNITQAAWPNGGTLAPFTRSIASPPGKGVNRHEGQKCLRC
jgi:hypothetical protein